MTPQLKVNENLRKITSIWLTDNDAGVALRKRNQGNNGIGLYSN